MLPLHHLIMQRREQLGIGKEEFASRIGLSESMYRDVEFYDDEFTMVLPLKNARSLAVIRGFELETLVGADSGGGQQKASGKPRHLVLAEARNRLGVSTEKMADDIGFEESFVHSIRE